MRSRRTNNTLWKLEAVPGTREDGLTRQGGEDIRCGCGSLLARLVSGGVEVKCRRCKRAVLLPVEVERLRRNEGKDGDWALLHGEVRMHGL
jgi:hypothetical protein